MIKHWRYFKYVCRHKWFVFIAGLKVGEIPMWRLIIHDYSKFSRAEWTPYVNRFFGGRAGVEDKELDPNEFKQAWKHHWTHNPHHWEYWTEEYTEPQQMPDTYAREMVADWLGAGRAITGSWDLVEWYNKNRARQVIHPSTRRRVENLLHMLGHNV
jgi:hypothetical protein